MKPNEQAAFVNAYEDNVGDVSRDEVADFVARYEAGEDIEYSSGHTSIMDALGVWHDAIKFANKHKET